MKKNKKRAIIISLLIVIVLAITLPVLWYNTSISPVNKNDSSRIKLTILLGSTAESISAKLDESGLIKNKLAFKAYVKLNKISNFKAGDYELSKDMSVEEIAKTLQTGTLYKENKVVITFIEGKTMRWFANKIEETTNNTKEDVFAKLEDEEYIDLLIDKYWFLTDDIKDKDIYYALEGYLFPETYFFENKDVTVEEIFEACLNQTEKVLNDYKDKIKEENYNVHDILTIASIIETEGLNATDRKGISSVIYNRLKANMAIQSDVTTYYAIKVEVGQRDLYWSDLNKSNPYNTRGPNMQGKLPIGPIASVSKASIDAALNPTDTDYLYFVADKNGKVYFTKNEREHSEIIRKLQDEGLWYEF